MSQLITLNEIVEINPRIPKRLKADLEQKISFVPMASVSETGSISSDDERPLRDVMKGYTYFQKGDVLLAKITPCFENGKAAVVNGLPHTTGFGSTEFHVFRPGKDVDAKYLFYQIWNPVFRFIGSKNMTGTAGQKRLPAGFLKRHKIPLPPLAEQKRIADTLDKADAIRRKRQQAVKLADDFLRATFLDMFGDPKANSLKTQTIELGEIAQILMGQSPKGNSYNTNGKGAPLLNGPAEFGRKYPKERQWTTEPKKYAAPGDILFCVRGATAGRLNWADKEYCIGRGLAALRPKKRISSEFIYKFLEFMYQYFQESSDGSTFINIPSNILKTLPVPDPSEIEEKQFTSIANVIEILRTRNETSLKESEDCFNALAQRAFRGEL